MNHYCPRCLRKWDCETPECAVQEKWICKECQRRLGIHMGKPNGAD